MIKAHKFGDYDYVYVCEKESVKDWLRSKGWTELHEMVSESGGNPKGSDHVKMEDIFALMDKAEAIIIYTRNVHENHRLTVMLSRMKIHYFNCLEIKKEDIDEYVIPKPECKRCGTKRQKGGGQTGCTPNWDKTKDMEWNLQHETNKPYYPEHDWNREYEEYE